MNNRQEFAAEIAVTCAVFAALFTLGVIGVSFIDWLGRGFGFTDEITVYLACMWAVQVGAIPILLDGLFKTKNKS